MMDSETIELAAKLVGVDGAVCWQSGEFMTYPDFYASWNPDTDDLTSYELANKADLSIIRKPEGVLVEREPGSGVLELYANHAGDRNAATRKAILVCAARIQQAKDQKRSKSKR